MTTPGEAVHIPELAAFVAAMQKLHRDANSPSSRTIGKTIGASHTAINGILNGVNFGKLPLFTAVVSHLGGDLEHFKALRFAAARATGRSLREDRSAYPPAALIADSHRRAFHLLARQIAALTWEHLQVRLPLEALDGPTPFTLYEELTEASRRVAEIRAYAGRLATLAAGPHPGGPHGYLAEIRDIQRALEQATDKLSGRLAAAQRALAALPAVFTADPG